MKHKKSRVGLMAALLLLVCLTACGTEGSTDGYDPQGTTSVLMEGEVFSEALESLDLEIAFRLFGFDAWGEDADAIEHSAVYYSTGATSECAAVILAPQESLDQVEESLKTWITQQKQALENYQPLEVAKLDNAIVERKGNCVLLVVPNDKQAAQGVLDGLAE